MFEKAKQATKEKKEDEEKGIGGGYLSGYSADLEEYAGAGSTAGDASASEAKGPVVRSFPVAIPEELGEDDMDVAPQGAP